MTYSQTSGLFTMGNHTFTGYSGNGDGLNNSDMQDVKGVGPLPQGQYTIEPPHVDHVTGPVSMCLVPAPANEMFGRGDFLIHGDNMALDHTASEGCIVLNHWARLQIGAQVLAGNNRLTVTA